LTRQKTEEILKGKVCDEIGFSLDALTEETYKKLKKGAKLETVEENIAYFLRSKGNCGSPFVSLHMLNMQETEPEIDGFIQKWTPLLGKGDHILVKDVHDFAGQVKDTRTKEQTTARKRLPCRQLWNFLYVSWDGDVMPCCMDPLRKLKIGNLNESSLEELWNGPRLEEIRHIHLQEKYNEIPLCSTCEYWWY
jgi:radical SAM protein with 4Fe4S-binding SPASM domain